MINCKDLFRKSPPLITIVIIILIYYIIYFSTRYGFDIDLLIGGLVLIIFYFIYLKLPSD